MNSARTGVRAALASGHIERRLDSDSLVDYLRYQTVHQPDTIVSGLHMLPPASYLRVRDNSTRIHVYWSPVVPVQEQITVEAARKAVRKALENLLQKQSPFLRETDLMNRHGCHTLTRAHYLM